MANPIATIASVAMMMRYSFDLSEAARSIEQAIERVLLEGHRTSDLTTSAKKSLGTRAMGDAISNSLLKE